jgi:hypothetical protein
VTGTDGIDVCYGAKNQAVGEESSNYREFLELVLPIIKLFEKGLIAKGTEIFIFTDNWATEQCFSKGTSRISLLFELVLRPRALEFS